MSQRAHTTIRLVALAVLVAVTLLPRPDRSQTGEAPAPVELAVQ